MKKRLLLYATLILISVGLSYSSLSLSRFFDLPNVIYTPVMLGISYESKHPESNIVLTEPHGFPIGFKFRYYDTQGSFSDFPGFRSGDIFHWPLFLVNTMIYFLPLFIFVYVFQILRKKKKIV